ncbi:MAG: hypothetical protein FWC20_11165 [Oscillospiraceae bacterium]|nr:hypothetical protein [Oscillospiraceae bacterium]MCL2279947.1 hypothetical protein [Oscillospiraceae bacterium]
MPIITSGKYYYARLNDKQKNAYMALLSGIEAHSDEVKIPSMSTDEASTMFNCLLNDNPLIFHVSSYSHFSYAMKSGIRPNYKYTKQVVKDYTDKILHYMKVFDSVKAKSDAEKELYVHDFCVKNFSYDSAFGEHAHSVLGPILHGTAVCEGISRETTLS